MQRQLHVRVTRKLLHCLLSPPTPHGHILEQLLRLDIHLDRLEKGSGGPEALFVLASGTKPHLHWILS